MPTSPVYTEGLTALLLTLTSEADESEKMQAIDSFISLVCPHLEEDDHIDVRALVLILLERLVGERHLP
jgi:hypothetical protein